MSERNSPEALAALDAWADKIAALEADVAAGVAGYAKRLAADRRLAPEDRKFAFAQADAIRRALKRAKAGRKVAAAGKAGRKPGKKS